jgi:membrane dipeptidase
LTLTEAPTYLDTYRDAIVIDGSIAPRMDADQVDRMIRSGVTAVNWTVCSPHVGLDGALSEIVDGLRVIEKFPDQLLLVRTAADIERAKAERKVGIIFGPQNARPVTADLRHVRALYELGVRIMLLTYNERNLLGDGVAEPANAGLSVFGRQVVEEMNRLGMVVDVSHCGDRVTTEAIEMSTAPVVITHANARAVHPSPRNKTDEHLRLLAANGGVIGLNMWSPMLAFDHWPTLDDWVKHVGHVADLVGIEHIGIGTDHNESASREEWTRNSSKGEGRYQSVTGGMGDWYVYETRCANGGSSILDFPRIAEALDRLGLTSSELAGVLGGNMLRVLRQVWGQ